MPTSRIIMLSLGLCTCLACSGDDDGSTQGTETGTTSSTTTGSTGTPGSTGPGGTGTGGSTGGSTGGPPSAADCDGSEAHTLYINFDGGTLVEGDEDDAAADTTGLAALATDLAPYGGSDQAEILAAVGVHYGAFDICVTVERPAAGPYTMVMVTPTNPFGGPPSVGPLDCANANDSNIAFAFSDSMPATGILAISISAQAGISYGLEFVAGSDDLMHTVPGDVTTDAFTETCLTVANANNCGTTHEAHCPEGEQSSHLELLATLGPA